MNSNSVFFIGKALFISILICIKVALLCGCFTGSYDAVFGYNAQLAALLKLDFIERFYWGFIWGCHMGLWLGAVAATLNFINLIGGKQETTQLPSNQ